MPQRFHTIRFSHIRFAGLLQSDSFRRRDQGAGSISANAVSPWDHSAWKHRGSRRPLCSRRRADAPDRRRQPVQNIPPAPARPSFRAGRPQRPIQERMRRRTQPSARCGSQALMALTRFARFETLRLAVFRCRTPLVTPRMISGCALRSASDAAWPSPDSIALSTRRINVLIRELRDRLIWVRRNACFARLRACLEFAISASDFRYVLSEAGL